MDAAPHEGAPSAIDVEALAAYTRSTNLVRLEAIHPGCVRRAGTVSSLGTRR